jgi:GTP-binding protein HflX
MSDTVGFIRDLPHGLVAAFHATLTEAMEADLLLHVIDAANPMRDQQIADVNLVLAEIGADNIAQVIVHNKIDQLEDTPLGAVLRDESGKIRECRVSALQGVGMAELRETIKEYGLENLAGKTRSQNPAESVEQVAIQ